MAQVFDALALLHITDRAAYADFTNFDGDAALPKELARACSLLVKLPKLSRNKIFTHRMRDSDFSTFSHELLASDLNFLQPRRKAWHRCECTLTSP